MIIQGLRVIAKKQNLPGFCVFHSFICKLAVAFQVLFLEFRPSISGFDVFKHDFFPLLISYFYSLAMFVPKMLNTLPVIPCNPRRHFLAGGAFVLILFSPSPLMPQVLREPDHGILNDLRKMQMYY